MSVTAWFQQLRPLRQAGSAKERDTTNAELLFLPRKLADHFAATIKELQDWLAI